ncbi:DUF7151 family protein [Pyxidicoccus parkwayensis]|nr:hypothetical protein [Pyxidicoccus parkwaysis]
MAVLALVTGCDGISLEQLSRQYPQLSRTEPEPVGANCSLGGHSVRIGLDRNGNGVLDDDEVASTTYACTTTVPQVLVRVETVEPGERCAHGGHVARAGPDVDGSGTLEDREVTREVYGCTEPKPEKVFHRIVNQPPASPHPPGGCSWGYTWVEAGPDVDGNGQFDDTEVRTQAILCVDPAKVMVEHMPEPAGTACIDGGTRIQAGIDADGNGQLSNLETHATAFVCKTQFTFYGDYFVRTPEDLAALQVISRIQGSLRVEDTPITELRLPRLVVVDHVVRLWNNPLLTRVELPGLRFVGDDLEVSSNPKLETMRADGADSGRLLVGRSFTLSGNSALRTLTGLQAVSPRLNMMLFDNDALEFHPGEDLPLLGIDFLAGSLDVIENDALQALPFANLLHAGSIGIARNKSLRSLNGLSPGSIGSSLYLENNEALVDVSWLAGVRSLDTLSVEGNTALTSLVGLRSLGLVKSLRVVDNPKLDRFDLPALSQVSQSFTVTGNPKLPTCLATALAAGTYKGIPEQLSITGNDDVATCGD